MFRVFNSSDRLAASPNRVGSQFGLVNICAFAGAVVLVVLSRLIYAPPYLYFFDNANFALSIDHFDPTLHQPQPPGYPLFVFLLKAIHVFLSSANHDLIVAGLVGTVVGLSLVWLWAAQMFGPRSAWAASGLLAAHPVFWVAGAANPVRTFLVIIVAAVSSLGWRCMTADDGRPWFYLFSGTLGLLAGFRPEALLLLLPLWGAVAWKSPVNLREWLIGTAVLVGATALWLTPMVLRMGGIGSMYSFFYSYLRSNSVNYTLAFGANASASAATIRRVAVWNLGLALAWLWAAPLTFHTLRAKWTRAHSVLLAWTFAPPFLFHALVHVRDPDQTLITIPVVCVLGGAVLGAIRSKSAMVLATTAAILVTGWNFAHPVFADMRGSSRRAMRFVNDWNRSTFSALSSVPAGDNTVLVWDDSVVTWRQVFYYYQDARLLVLASTPPFWMVSRVGRSATVVDGEIFVPHANFLVLGVSAQEGRRLSLMHGAEMRGPLVVLSWGEGAEVEVGRYLLRWSPDQPVRRRENTLGSP
jgi:hypothetical protein